MKKKLSILLTVLLVAVCYEAEAEDGASDSEIQRLVERAFQELDKDVLKRTINGVRTPVLSRKKVTEM